MSDPLFDPIAGRRWPLHPQPLEWDDLETWVRRIAGMYGVSYDAFLLHALGHSGGGARDLEQAPAAVFARLSAGTGLPIEQLREMTLSRVLSRLFVRTPELLATPEGQAIIGELNALSSRRRRRQAVINNS